MDLRGQQHIPADRETVWKALNDPEILKACIPGCEELTRISDTEMAAVAAIRVGPVSARFRGTVTISDLDPPNGYTISGEGQGGVAGFARGSATVRLEPVQDGTLLHYDAAAEIGGKLSQLGARLIDATARKLAAAFFEKFEAEIRARQQPSAPPAPPVPPAAPADRPADVPAQAKGASRWSLVAAAVLGGAIVLIWLQYFGHPAAGAPTGLHLVSAEFFMAVQLVMAGLLGYLLGLRR